MYLKNISFDIFRVILGGRERLVCHAEWEFLKVMLCHPHWLFYALFPLGISRLLYKSLQEIYI
jgi:hypothetical protein